FKIKKDLLYLYKKFNMHYQLSTSLNQSLIKRQFLSSSTSLPNKYKIAFSTTSKITNNNNDNPNVSRGSSNNNNLNFSKFDGIVLDVFKDGTLSQTIGSNKLSEKFQQTIKKKLGYYGCSKGNLDFKNPSNDQELYEVLEIARNVSAVGVCSLRENNAKNILVDVM
ncbi:21675_t:CDS:2, partial [Entrophospora sp. SA101]